MRTRLARWSPLLLLALLLLASCAAGPNSAVGSPDAAGTVSPSRAS